MADTSHKQLLATLKNVVVTGAFSDLTVTCGPDSYKVHKVIVCERAEFFARSLKFGGKESQSGIIDLLEDEPAVVKLLIQYIYEGEYEPPLPDGESWNGTNPPRQKLAPDGHPYSYQFPHACTSQHSWCDQYQLCPHHTCSNNCSYSCSNFNCEECNRPAPPLPSLNGNSDQLLLHAKMYEIADKYDVVGLKDLVIEEFYRACHHFWNDGKFSIAAHHVFSTTPDHDKGLREIVSKTISENMELVDVPAVKVLMTEFNGLALGILEEKIKEHGWGKKK